MSDAFFASPILNSPYQEPQQHWELDENGQPTSMVVPRRRTSALVSPIPKARKIRGKAIQADLLTEGDGQEYNPTEVINGVRSAVDSWRRLPESQWQVTPSTARLLRHWRTHDFANQKPFFCQVEAVETVIWLNNIGPLGRWAFAEFTDVWTIRTEFAVKIEAWLDGVTMQGGTGL